MEEDTLSAHGCLDAHTPDDPGKTREVVANAPDSTVKPGVEIGKAF